MAPGLALDFDRGVISGIAPGSPAERAGLHTGDSVEAIDGRPVRTLLALQVIESNLVVGTPLRLRVSRAGIVSNVDVPIGWLEISGLTIRNRLALWVARGVQGVTLLLALLVALKRPDDAMARVGAAFLASIAVFTVLVPLRFFAAWRSLPMPLEALLWIPFLAWIAVGALWFSFCALFPRKTTWSRFTWAVILTPLAIIEAWHGWRGALILYAPDQAVSIPDWSVPVIATIALYVVAGIVLLVVKYRFLIDPNERRRVRVVMIGSIAGLAAGLPVVIGRWVGVSTSGADSLAASPGSAIGMLLLLSFPVAFAYATLRHRMFDVAVMVRQGLRYTLARRLLLSLGPALIVLIVTDALLHHDQTLDAVIRDHGLFYGGMAAVIVVAGVKRESWLESLIRQFFRERYNAQRLVRGLVEEIRTAPDLASVAQTITRQIESTLHNRLRADRTSRERRLHVSRARRASGGGPEAAKTYKIMGGAPGVLRNPWRFRRAIRALWLRYHLPAGESESLQRSGISGTGPHHASGRGNRGDPDPRGKAVGGALLGRGSRFPWHDRTESRAGPRTTGATGADRITNPRGMPGMRCVL